MRNIKKEYSKHLASYVIANFIIFFLCLFSFSTIELFKEYSKVLNFISSAALGSLCSVFTIPFINIISSNTKDILIFWRVENILPSNRWLSLIKNDKRIDIKSLKKHYSISKKMYNQNNLWYKLYNINKEDERILTSQKEYLFARDITIATFLFFIIGIVCIIVDVFILNNSTSFLILYSFILLILYLIFMAVTRNSANRFVCNVLAIESNKD